MPCLQTCFQTWCTFPSRCSSRGLVPGLTCWPRYSNARFVADMYICTTNQQVKRVLYPSKHRSNSRISLSYSLECSTCNPDSRRTDEQCYIRVGSAACWYGCCGSAGVLSMRWVLAVASNLSSFDLIWRKQRPQPPSSVECWHRHWHVTTRSILDRHGHHV